VYNSVNYDKVYVIAKAKQGTDGGCALDTLTDFNIFRSQGGGEGVAGFRAHLDGTIDTASSAFPAVWVNKETWKGVCAASQYEGNLKKTAGVTPTGPALNTWHLLSTTRQWTISETNGAVDFTGTFEIRRVSDGKVLKLVNAGLHVDSSP
jgi:hypothetical protein